MRIISGSARGTHIQAPEGMETRPVTDKIRQSLFNIWQFDIPGSRFLDIFSGSGSMALEALSRGAKKAVMIEMSKKAADVIRANLKTCHFEKKDAKILEADAFQAIPALEAAGETFDYIYLDPPYTVESIFDPVMEVLGSGRLLAQDGILAIRSHIDKPMKDQYGVLKKYREKKYGISMVHFYKVEKPAEE